MATLAARLRARRRRLRHPLDAREVMDLTRMLAGVPVQSLERIGTRLADSPQAAAAAQQVRQSGYALVVTANAPQPLVDGLGRGLGAHVAAGAGTEVRYGRLTGRMTAPWAGPCRRLVCPAAACRPALREHGRPLVAALGDHADPCMAALRPGAIGPLPGGEPGGTGARLRATSPMEEAV